MGRIAAIALVVAGVLAPLLAPVPAGADDGPAVPPAPFAAWSDFVGRTYQYLLDAVPSDDQRAAAVDGLSNGATSPGPLIAELRTTPDQTTNVDPTVRLYRAFFLRIPDAKGLQYWITARRSAGWTLVRMADQFASSSEFRNRYGTLSNQAFVELIYANVLERPPDAGGVRFWTAQLDQRRRGRGSVMVGFSESNEYRTKQASEVTASVLPILLWDQAPTPATFAAWVTMLDGGTTVADLATTVLADPAFVARASRQRVVVIGDSVPNSLINSGRAGTDLHAYDLINGGTLGCDGADHPPPARTTTGQILAMNPACGAGWPVNYPPLLRFRTDRAVLMVGPHAMLDHQIAGVWRHPCHAPAKAWYHDDLVARLTYLKANVGRAVLVLPAWPGPNSGWVMPRDYVKRADCVRAVMKQAAADTGTPTVDLGAHLCPTSSTSCGPERARDGIHIDAEDAPAVLTWLLAATSPP